MNHGEDTATSMGAPLPARIGRYEIVSELGRGGMGVVYRARDPRIDRTVALKVLTLPLGTDPAVVTALSERFLNEARAAGRLSHPNVVAVFDADVDATTGQPFLAMELVEGTDLRALMNAGIAPQRLLAILSQVAAALDHARERGVVHRDVKPANILVAPDGLAKLTDFGIARLEAQNLTQTGQFLGSPSYMSPEQILSKPITGATDIYSLAVVAYEGLTGKRPFEGDSLFATTHAITHDEPRRPSSVVSTLPPGIDPVLARGLAKAPEARPASAGEFVREVTQAHAASAMPGPSHAGGTAGAGEAGRSKGKLVAVAGLVLVAIVIAVVGLRSGSGDDEAQAVAALPAVGPSASPGGDSTPPPATWDWADKPEAPADPVAQPAQADRKAPAAMGPSRARATGAPAATAAAEAAGVGHLRIDLFTFQEGTFSVRDGETLLLRHDTGRLDKKSRKLRNPKERYRLTAEVPAGRRTLTFAFVQEGRPPLVKRSVKDIGIDTTLEVVVDVGTLGRDLDVRWP